MRDKTRFLARSEVNRGRLWREIASTFGERIPIDLSGPSQPI